MNKYLLCFFIIVVVYTAYTDDCVDNFKKIYTIEIENSNKKPNVCQYYVEATQNGNTVLNNNYKIKIFNHFVYTEDDQTDVFQNDSLSVMVYHEHQAIYIAKENQSLFNFSDSQKNLAMLEEYYNLINCENYNTDTLNMIYLTFIPKDMASTKNVLRINILMDVKNKYLVFTNVQYYDEQNKDTISTRYYKIQPVQKFRNSNIDTLAILNNIYKSKDSLISEYKDYKVFDLRKPRNK